MTIPNIKALLEQGRQFLFCDLWIESTKAESKLRKTAFFLCRIAMIIARGYQEDKCSLQAAGLTYITLVSMVPVLAIMLSFSKGIGMQKKLIQAIGLEEYRQIVIQDDGTEKSEIHYRVIPAEVQSESPEGTEDGAMAEAASEVTVTAGEVAMPEVATSSDAVAEEEKEFADDEDEERPTAGLAATLPEPMQQAIVNIMVYVQKTNFAALGLVGSLMLIVSVILSMSKLEKNINTIWGIKRGRSVLRQVSEYLIVLIMIPIAVVASTSLNTMLASNRFATFLLGRSTAFAVVSMLAGRALSFLFIMGGFVFFYMFMPNTKVRFVPALVSGTLACIAWFAVQWAYIVLQVGLANYNAIYGTFAVVPFFLAWLYANWSLLLFGAEVSFALQNHRTLKLEKASDNNSYGSNIIISFLIVYETCRNFLQGKGGWSPDEFAIRHAIPTKSILSIVEVLRREKILLPVSNDSTDAQEYLPGVPPEQLSLDIIEEAFREQNGTDARQYLEYLPKHVTERFLESYIAYKNNLASLNFQTLIEGEKQK